MRWKNILILVTIFCRTDKLTRDVKYTVLGLLTSPKNYIPIKVCSMSGYILGRKSQQADSVSVQHRIPLQALNFLNYS